MMYVNVRETVNSKPRLVPDTTNLQSIISHHKDWYRSLYKYTEAQKQIIEETGTVSGIKDTITDLLFFDFDSKNDIEKAREDALTAANRLIEAGFPEDSIGCYFTGSKGFSLEVQLNELLTVEQFKAVIHNIAGDLTSFDHVVSDPNRIVRIAGTKHNKSGLYKIPLTPEELTETTLDDIKLLAKYPRKVERELNKTNVPEELKQLPVEKEVTSISKELTFDISSIDMKARPPRIDEARWLIINGFFRTGERNYAMLCTASTWKNLNLPQDVVKGMMLGTAKMQAERTGEEEFPENEIDLILNQVYGPHWKGGQFTTKDPSNWLAKYAIKMGIKVKEEDNGPMLISDVEDEFTEYVKNIEQNTVLTGIEFLDRKMPITLGTNVAIVGAPGSGKCLGKDTPVIMYDGTIKMVQDVVVGDLLMGDDSTPRKVLGTTTGREILYKVKQNNGDDYVVNASHILSVKTNENKGLSKKGDVLDINVEEYKNKTEFFKRRYKGYKVPSDFGNKEVLVDPYFLGLWLGDGTSASTSVTNIDPEVKLFLQEYADKLGMIYYEAENKNRTETLKIVSKRGAGGGNGKGLEKSTLQKLMDHYNLFNNKHIPLDYKQTNRENRLSLLAGLIDSDGYVYNKEKTYIEITQKNKELVNDICFIARSLGFKVSLTEERKYCYYKEDKREGDYCRLYITGNKLDEIPTKIHRKKIKNTNSRVDFLLTSIEIESIGEGDYYGFEIDGNKRFLLGDFTVTHNTTLALNILKNCSAKNMTTVFFSLDMPRKRMFEKIMYDVTGMKRADLYDAFKQGRGKELVKKMKEQYGSVWFYDRTATSPAQMADYVREVEAHTGTKVRLVMIDYLERVSSEKSSDTEASKDIATKIQDLVMDLDVAAITLVQPNKAAYSGGPDTPIESMSAIKGSSYLQQSYRNILSLWRPGYTPSLTEYDKFMEFAILKNDLGELGKTLMGFDGAKGRIRNLEDFEYAEYKELMQMKKDLKASSDDDGWN